jgi:hypothetical protein
MEWVIGWIVLSALAGSIAKSKGRSAAAYFFCSMLFSPLVGIILALAVRPDNSALESKELRAGTARKCPSCAELVKPEAIKCKHCGAELPAQIKPPPGLLARIFGGM